MIRRWPGLLAGILVVGGMVATPRADDTAKLKPIGKDKPLDIKAVFDKLDVYRDEFGMYFVSPRARAFTSADDTNQYVFYGDAKTMYRQWIVGSSTGQGESSWTLWSPRVKGIRHAQVELKDKTPTDTTADSMNVTCEMRDRKYMRRPLTQLAADQAKIFLQKATFYPPLWQREAHYLARDDDGVYYFVDKLQSQYGGAGFRVFVGQKGAVKELVMTNIVSDSAGEIYATKSGDLKIVTSDTKAYWKKGDKKVELVVLPPGDNRYLIYRELGMYGRLGVVCDEM